MNKTGYTNFTLNDLTENQKGVVERYKNYIDNPCRDYTGRSNNLLVDQFYCITAMIAEKLNPNMDFKSPEYIDAVGSNREHLLSVFG